MNGLCVISLETYGDYAIHDIQTNSAWTENPYGSEYAIVPDNMVEAIFETRGFCDIKLNDEGTEVVSFTTREFPIIEDPEQPVSEMERLRADVEYLAIMTGVEL